MRIDPRGFAVTAAVMIALGAGALATELAPIPGREDATMQALCAIPPILREEAFFEDRVGFNWTGTTGTPLERLPVEVPGYAPEPGATMEEMRVHRPTVGMVANAALGRGGAWAQLTNSPGAEGGLIPELLPHGPQDGPLIHYAVAKELGPECALQDWLLPLVRDARDPYRTGRVDFMALGIREELEVSVPEAIRTLEVNRAAGRCVSAQWAPRAALPLRAFRAYEQRNEGPYTYWLSPHVVTRNGEVVYFSMGVVRRTRALEMLGNRGPDPGERVCCVTPLPVGGCSRYGGPDPYMFYIRGMRAVWRVGQPVN